MIDKNDVIINLIALQLTNGTGLGDFALPDTLQKGSYRISAYTEWTRGMMSIPYFFDQYIFCWVSEQCRQGCRKHGASGKTNPAVFP